jgi:hypothetical protein
MLAKATRRRRVSSGQGYGSGAVSAAFKTEGAQEVSPAQGVKDLKSLKGLKSLNV